MTTTTQLPAHSKLGASSYERWKACPGSIRENIGCPEQSSVYALDGNRAHSIAAHVLSRDVVPNLNEAHKIWIAEEIDAEVSEQEYEEMLEAVKIYLRHVQSLRSEGVTVEYIEQKFDLSEYYPSLFGTADYVGYFEKTKILHVVDYKHGAGVLVEVEGNLQLRYYALGALHALKKPVDKVVITVVQPRCFSGTPIRSETVDSVELVEFGFQLVEDAKATEYPQAPIVPGDHCRWCPANATCEGPRKVALMAAQNAFPEIIEEEKAIGLNAPSPERVAEYLALIPRVEAWIDSVSTYAYQMAEKGHEIPGFSLVPKVARRKWADDVDANQLGKALNMMPNNFTEEKLKSPAQVEKLIKKDIDKLFVLDQLVVKESSGKTLVPNVKAKTASAIDKMFK